MSYEELDRVSMIERVIQKRLTQVKAARILALTSRRVRRLRRAYERGGARGLGVKASGKAQRRGEPVARRDRELNSG